METRIGTERLRLRELTLADLDFVEELMSHPEVMRFFAKCYSRAEAEDWVRRQRERYETVGHGYWLVEEKTLGHPVGQAGVMLIEVEGAELPALGYIIHRPYWGRGYATEAAAASRDYAFDTLGRRRVITLIRPENRASQRVAEKIGMRAERQTTFAGFEHVLFSATRDGRRSRSGGGG